ncbi:hypothetical protein AAVH_28623 [Aphelenchoides avenae]|nr:hypothetical protein AAVH_28623 [Aphelenchus avenae]
MESAADKDAAKGGRTVGHDKTEIPQETMLEVLRWLDRFDLDGKQITSRRLRSLVENNQMPLRKVAKVYYRGGYGPWNESDRLQFCFKDDEKDRPAQVELTFETDADVQKAAAYLSSCFVRIFVVYEHMKTLPRNAVIAAPPLIHELAFGFCNFDKGGEDTLSATLNGSTFRCLSLFANTIPAWQMDDKRLESLRRRGCNKTEVNGCGSKYGVTEEGILSYCFTLEDDLPVPERRYLRTDAESATITPAFFKKVEEASKNSQLTCDVEVRLLNLRFDVSNLDVGVLPSRSQEYDRSRDVLMHHIRYDLADHGNGVRLLEWEAVVRHGKKDHKEFFGLPKEEEENDEQD